MATARSLAVAVRQMHMTQSCSTRQQGLGNVRLFDVHVKQVGKDGNSGFLCLVGQQADIANLVEQVGFIAVEWFKLQPLTHRLGLPGKKGNGFLQPIHGGLFAVGIDLSLHGADDYGGE